MLIIETMTTVEMKCGMYVMVCTNPLILVLPIWLISSARMIGAMKPITSVHRLMRSVLPTMVPNIGEVKNLLKYLSPTKLPPVRPWRGS